METIKNILKSIINTPERIDDLEEKVKRLENKPLKDKPNTGESAAGSIDYRPGKSIPGKHSFHAAYRFSDTYKIHLENRNKELEKEIEELKNHNTIVVDIRDDFCGTIPVTLCCKQGPITNENYCPNCGKKILKS